MIGAKDEDVSFAIGTNTLFGTLAVFAYPVIGHWAGFSESAFGTWAGTAVNDTSQVVATGFAFSEGAGKIATAVKLTRNALMGAVIVLMGFLHARSGEDGGKRETFLTRLKQSVPLFVVGFLAMAALNSLGAFSWVSGLTGRDVNDGLKEAAQALILVALAGVGLGTRTASMRRIGLRPFYVGLATALITSLASLALIRVLGPAGGR